MEMKCFIMQLCTLYDYGLNKNHGYQWCLFFLIDMFKKYVSVASY